MICFYRIYCLYLHINNIILFKFILDKMNTNFNKLLLNFSIIAIIALNLSFSLSCSGSKPNNYIGKDITTLSTPNIVTKSKIKCIICKGKFISSGKSNVKCSKCASKPDSKFDCANKNKVDGNTQCNNKVKIQGKTCGCEIYDCVNKPHNSCNNKVGQQNSACGCSVNIDKEVCANNGYNSCNEKVVKYGDKCGKCTVHTCSNGCLEKIIGNQDSPCGKCFKCSKCDTLVKGQGAGPGRCSNCYIKFDCANKNKVTGNTKCNNKVETEGETCGCKVYDCVNKPHNSCNNIVVQPNTACGCSVSTAKEICANNTYNSCSEKVVNSKDKCGKCIIYTCIYGCGTNVKGNKSVPCSITCDYRPDICKHSCGKTDLKHKNKVTHESSCYYRPATCKHSCGETGLKYKDKSTHESSCDYRPVACKHSCGKNNLKYKDKSTHESSCYYRPYICAHCERTVKHKDKAKAIHEDECDENSNNICVDAGCSKLIPKSERPGGGVKKCNFCILEPIVINIFYVRHAQGTHNTGFDWKRFTNKGIDPALTENGENQSDEIGTKIKNGVYPCLNSIDAVLSSPQKRTLQTAIHMFKGYNITAVPYTKEVSSSIVKDNKLSESIETLKTNIGTESTRIDFSYVKDADDEGKFSEEAQEASLDQFIHKFLIENINKLVSSLSPTKEVNLVLVTHSHAMKEFLPKTGFKSKIKKPKNNSIVKQVYKLEKGHESISPHETMNYGIESFQSVNDAIIFPGYQ